MPSTAWRDLRRDILRDFGLIQSITSTAIVADATTIVSDELAAEYPSDGAFNGSFVTLVRQSDGGELADDNVSNPTRRITSYTASTGTLTLAGTGYAAEAETVEFDLFRYNPRFVARAYNRAARSVFSDGIGIIRDNDTLVTGINQHIYAVPRDIRKIYTVYMGSRLDAEAVQSNVLLNPSFERWSGSPETPSDWIVPTGDRFEVKRFTRGNPQYDYFVLSGNSAVYIQDDLTDDDGWAIYQNIRYPTFPDRLGTQITASAWVYSEVPNFIGIVLVGENVLQAGTRQLHQGTGWEYISETINGNSSNIDIGVGRATSILTNNISPITTIIDNVIVVIGPLLVPDAPYIPASGYRHIPATNGDAGYGQLYFETAPPPTRRLRIVGLDTLSQVRADDDDIELDGDWLEPVIYKSQEYLAEEMIVTSMGDTALESMYRNMAAGFRAKYDDVLARGAVQRIPIPDLRQYSNVGLSDRERRVIG